MTKQATKKDPMGATFHRDGTVTFWSVYRQVWARMDAERISDRELAAMSDTERARVARMAALRCA